MEQHSAPLLLTPGPVPLSPSVLESLSQPVIHHRSPEFSELFLSLQDLLKKYFQTRQMVLTLNASGTGAMSAALLNTLSPKDKVLAVCGGKFGESWAEMAKAYHLQVQRLEVPWGQAVPIEDVQRALEKDPSIKALLIQACETSTGVWHPVQELAALTRSRDQTLCIVDAISAVGALSVPMDSWGIDILIGGSQKAFALPTGLSFLSLSEKAWRFNQSSRLPVYYFDLRKEKTAQLKGYTAFSSNVLYTQALYLSLQEDNLERRWAHTQNMSRTSIDFCRQLGLEIFAKSPSPSVTAITLPPYIKEGKLRDDMKAKYGVIVAGGQGPLEGKIIRIGHLSPLLPAQLIRGLKALACCLQNQAPGLIKEESIKKAYKHLQTQAFN